MIQLLRPAAMSNPYAKAFFQGRRSETHRQMAMLCGFGMDGPFFLRGDSEGDPGTGIAQIQNFSH
jgi:hypothetical protein